IDFNLMTSEQKVAVWMHRLRDRNVRSHRDRLFNQAAGNEAVDPYDKLVELGTTAIPAILEHFDDSRPTLSFVYSRHGLSHQERYSDLCQQLFARITGRRKFAQWHMVGADKVPEPRKLAEEWWRDFQSLGEVGMLRREVEEGSQYSPELAE